MKASNKSHLFWSIILIILVLAEFLYGSTQEINRIQHQGCEKRIHHKMSTVDSSQLRKHKGIVKLKNSAKPYTGLVVDKYTNGQKRIETTYEDGKKNGPYTEWYFNGQKKEEGAYKEGREHGVWNGWHPNGQKKKEIHYGNGQSGNSIEFYMNGKKKLETGLNKDGNYIVTEWYDNGKKKSETIYKEGLILEKKWDINGKLIKRKKHKIRGW
jgi:antitoxin component YwqK of YwqJK toxin-antitoxin module